MIGRSGSTPETTAHPSEESRLTSAPSGWDLQSRCELQPTYSSRRNLTVSSCKAVRHLNRIVPVVLSHCSLRSFLSTTAFQLIEGNHREDGLRLVVGLARNRTCSAAISKPAVETRDAKTQHQHARVLLSSICCLLKANALALLKAVNFNPRLGYPAST